MAHEAVHGSIRLVVDVTTLRLAKLDSIVNQALVGRLVGGLEDERRVGGRILRLVNIDRCVVYVSPDASRRGRFVTYTQSHRSRRRRRCRSA